MLKRVQHDKPRTKLIQTKLSPLHSHLTPLAPAAIGAILTAMIDEYALDDVPITPAMFDVDQIETILQQSAADQHAMSYSELLLMLGYRFTRPKMRALCKVLDVIDRRGAARGEPELAVLVVREGDRLPGQGWWIGRADYQGEWTGPRAAAFISVIQSKAFSHWQKRMTG